MKISKINISNVKCVDNLELSLLDENNGSPRNVLVLVGENGTGKTTVLEAISSCFTINRRVYNGKVLGKGDVKNGETYASISVDLTFNKNELLNGEYVEKSRIMQSIVKEKVKYNNQTHNAGNYNYLLEKDIGFYAREPSFFISKQFDVGNILFFDSYRIVSDEKITGPNTKIPQSPFEDSLMPSINDRFKPERFQFTKQWLVNLDYKEAKLYRARHEDSGLLNRVTNAFNILMAPYTFSRVSDKSEILFTTPGGEIEIGLLSAGMKAVFSILGDILFRFSLPYMDKEGIDVNAVLNTEAVVLIDEIDCHLHPKWQLNIIPAMRSLFPNTQFIITTHSPLIVKSVNPNEVVKLGGGNDNDQTSD